MPYIVVSTEEPHVLPDTEHYELDDNRLHTFDGDGEETALFNFDNVATVQSVTDEELDELMEMF